MEIDILMSFRWKINIVTPDDYISTYFDKCLKDQQHIVKEKIDLIVDFIISNIELSSFKPSSIAFGAIFYEFSFLQQYKLISQLEKVLEQFKKEGIIMDIGQIQHVAYSLNQMFQKELDEIEDESESIQQEFQNDANTDDSEGEYSMQRE